MKKITPFFMVVVGAAFFFVPFVTNAQVAPSNLEALYNSELQQLVNLLIQELASLQQQVALKLGNQAATSPTSGSGTLLSQQNPILGVPIGAPTHTLPPVQPPSRPQDSGNANFVAGSAAPLVPMTSDGLQIYSPSYPQHYWTICPTNASPSIPNGGSGTSGNGSSYCDGFGAPNNVMTTAGLMGADEGTTVTTPDGKVIFLFGDTLLTWRDPASGHNILYRNVAGPDTIGFFGATSTAADWSQCHYIENLDNALSSGENPSLVSSANCPVLTAFSRIGPTPPPIADYQNANTLTGLGESNGPFTENYGPDATPTGAFMLSGSLYELYADMPEFSYQGQYCSPADRLNVILAKSTTQYPSWSTFSPPTFAKLYDVSHHATVANCSNPATSTQATDPGKFMFDSPIVLSSTTLSSLGILSYLPASIQADNHFVFVVGASWYYRQSNAYLAVIGGRDVDNGLSGWWYLTGYDANGHPNWQQGNTPAQSNYAEENAVPLFTSWNNPSGGPTVGENSMEYIPELGEFVMLYGSPKIAGGIYARTAKTPWGPWSPETNIFPTNGTWGMKLSQKGANNMITQDWPPVYDSPSSTNPHSFANVGAGVYGPNIIADKYTVNSDGSVTLYYTSSFFVP